MPHPSNQAGRIAKYEFYVARTSEELSFKIHNKDCHANDVEQSKSTLVAFNKPVTGTVVALISLDHDGSGTCSEFNIYDSPEQTPSQSPSETPTATASQSPSESPLPTESLLFDDDRFESDGKGRIEKTKEESSGEQDLIQVKVIVSKFEGKTNDFGGAIHLINYGLDCDGSKFTSCTSNVGGGGGIYIKNSVEEKNPVSITNVEMTDCSAQYGGAIYVYSEKKQSKVSIVSSKFGNNRATLASGQDGLFGGASIFITAKVGKISKCTFGESDDSSSISQVKVSNNFDASSASTLDSSSAGLFEISDSKFESKLVSKSSLFYVRGNGNVQLKVKNCIFTGELSEGAHYIDGQIIGNNSPKMIVSSCAFESDKSKAVNSIESDNLVSMDIAKQIFNYKKEMKNKDYNYKTVALLSLIGVGAIIAAAVKAKNSYSSEQSDNVKEETNNALV